tara:strand:- start:203 stop:952 length:750 start_codon:yes stop_codon:yes gene_type:complete
MRLGALLVPDDGTNPRSITQQAVAIEAAGYDSIWSAQAMGRGFMMHDPFVALTAAAAVTDRVELGIAILQLPLYNASDVAMKSFSMAQVANNRFLLGLGVGSTASDFEIHRENFGERFEVFDERVKELRQAFSTGVINDQSMHPWAGVEGGPPLLYGTWGRRVQRAAREFDGWIASGMHRSPEACASTLLDYRSAGGGRAIVSTIRVMPDTDLQRLQKDLAIYAEAGFDDAVVMIFPGGPGLDEVRSLV